MNSMFKLSALFAIFFLSSCGTRSGLSQAHIDGSLTAEEVEDPFVDVIQDLTEDPGGELVESTPEDLGEPETHKGVSLSEIEADRDAQNTFPLVRNEFVDQWIKFFAETPRGRAIFERWLKRAPRYAPLIQRTLREEGLPEDLLYLAMIESGFSPLATSRVGAAGVWQFMPYTGRNYGLKLTHWYDERRDIVASTKAAATYLKELHQVFGSWYLAAASYNAGEGRTMRVVRENKTRNFWELIRGRGNYMPETRNYVPKIIAAALISKNPSQYGFNVTDVEPPLTWVRMPIEPGVDLRAVATVTNTPYETLRLLNPELRRGITPPDVEKWEVRIPPEKREVYLARQGELKGRQHGHFITHRLARGETLSHVSRRYGIDVRTIMDLNNIRDPRRLRQGQQLQVPLDPRRAQAQARSAAPRAQASSWNPNTQTSAGSDGSYSVYKVRRGDNLNNIARRFGTSVSELQRLNGIRGSRIFVGQDLKVPSSGAAASSGGSTRVHQVRRGENLSSIAARYGTNVARLRSLNNIRGSRILVGQNIRVPAPQYRVHRVQRGETLTQIAQRFNVSVEDLKQTNNIRRGRNLQAGASIRIPQNL
jgi:membrane-bound lytic murein transglycosylase D